MPDTLLRALPLVLVVVFLSALLYTLARSRRWRREHGASKPPLVDPELTRFGTPFSPTRVRAARLVRDGCVADDPATAYVVVLLAERELGTPEDPWRSRSLALLLLVQLQLVLSQLINRGAGTLFILLALALLVGCTVALGWLGERSARRRRERVERALRLNRAPAAGFHGARRAQGEEPT